MEPTTTKTQEKAFPFTYNGWDEGGGEFGDLQFYDVEFTEDFGPIKKGDMFACIVVMHCNATLIAYSEDGTKELHVVPFKAVPAK